MKTLCTLVLTLGALLVADAVLLAGPIPASPVFTNKLRFRIPFRYDPAEMQALGAKEIRLFVSRDRGTSWQATQSVAPESGKFNFQAPGDGEYWFIVRTVDARNRLHPEGDFQEPGLQVIVDTTQPKLHIELKQPAPGRVLLSWTTSDEHLDPTQLRLEYVQPGTPNWQTVSIVPKPVGQTEWSVPQGGLVAVRGTVSDLARNMGQDQTQIRIAPSDQAVPRPAVPDLRQPIATPQQRQNALAGGPGIFGGHSATNAQDPFLNSPFTTTSNQVAPANSALQNATPERFEPIRGQELPITTTAANSVGPVIGRRSLTSHPGTLGNQAAPPYRDASTDGNFEVARASNMSRYRVVNSRSFQIGYKLQDVGASGVSAVELFITQDDGNTWYKYGDDNDTQSPVHVEVPRPGVYGFALGVRSGVGLATDPPQNGEKPSIVVVVDQTPPQIEMLPLEQGRGKDSNKILIQWKYQDENPTERPVSISYAVSPHGPWQPITGWQENTGRYIWTVGPNTPSKFILRLEARDSAGNMQVVETKQPIMIDLSRPTAKIIDIESTGNGQPQ